MKKAILFLTVFLIAAASFGQSLIGFRPVYVIPDTSTKFTMQVKAGDLVWVSSLKLLYQLEIPIGVGKTMGYIIASPSRYSQSNGDVFGGFGPTYYVDTATAQNVHGVKTFYSAPDFSFGTGSYNVGVGSGAMSSNTSGVQNVGVGRYALKSNTSGASNVAIGSSSMYGNTTGGSNVAVGLSSMLTNTTGTFNASLGYQTLYNQTTGVYNTALGYNAGLGNKTGGSNVFIGKNAGPNGTTSTTSNKLYISNVVGGSDTALVYGDFSAQTLQLNAATRVQKLTLQSDTAVDDPLYTIAVKGSHVYVKVSLTGATSVRWKQIDN